MVALEPLVQVELLGQVEQAERQVQVANPAQVELPVLQVQAEHLVLQDQAVHLV